MTKIVENRLANPMGSRTPDRSGAGYGAKLRRCVDLASAGCTGLPARLLVATVTP